MKWPSKHWTETSSSPFFPLLLPFLSQQDLSKPHSTSWLGEMCTSGRCTLFLQCWRGSLHQLLALFLLMYTMQRVYTDANLFDPKILDQTNEDIATIQICFNYKESDSTVLVLDVFYVGDGELPDEPNIQTIYHLADHEKRVIFFLDDVDASNLSASWEIQNITSESHLRKSYCGKHLILNLWCDLIARLWNWSSILVLHPTLSSCFQAIITNYCWSSGHHSVLHWRLVSVFIYDVYFHQLIPDLMTATYSTSPFTSDNLYKILSLSSEMESQLSYYCNDWLILMIIFKTTLIKLTLGPLPCLVRQIKKGKLRIHCWLVS